MTSRRLNKMPKLHFQIRLLGPVLIIAGLWLGAAGSAPTTPADQFERPDTATIRNTTRNILESPAFSPHKSFRQWLMEKLILGLPRNIDRFSGVGQVIFWILLVWCILTLIAILTHFIWTIVMMVKGRSGPIPPGKRRPHFMSEQNLTYPQLLDKTNRSARQGAYRQALGLMMLALLRRLEAAGILHYHQSKTNGDYLREYQTDQPQINNFKRFVQDFEGLVYGGGYCEYSHYQRLRVLFEQIGRHVEK